MSSDGNKRFSLSRSLRVLALWVALSAVMVNFQAARFASGQASTEMLHFPELDAGFRLLYQLKFREARAQFEAWQKSHPEGALGYSSEAASYLFEESDRLGILTSDFFLDDKCFLGNVPLEPDPKLREAFFTANKRAQDVAQFRLSENGANPNALFAMAMSLGMQADYAGLIEKRHLDSLKKIREAETYSKKLLAVSPAAYDAYFGLGIVNYTEGSLPRPKKFFLGLAGIHGNKAKGINQLGIAATDGHYLRPFAKILLALTALREKKPEVARTEFTELASEFPENPLFASELAKLNASPAVGTPKSSTPCPNPH
jgi:tetratricopeptide (TPR) repeat protein